MPSKYDEIDLKPTKAMYEDALRGLAWRKEFKRGGTAVGINSARVIVRAYRQGSNISPAKWRHIAKYFPRHEVDKKATGYRQGEKGYPSNGRIAWALWGGDAGKSRSSKIVRQLNAADKSAEFRQGVTEFFAVENIDDEERQYRDGLEAIANRLDSAEITKSQAASRLYALAVAIIVIAFLDGKHEDDRDGMSDNEAVLFLAAIRLLNSAVDGDLRSISQQVRAIVGSGGRVEDALPLREVQQLDEAFNAHRDSAATLADEVKKGVVVGVLSATVINRLSIWRNKLREWFSVGQTYNPLNPELTWRRGATEKGCSDCINYDGQTRTASEWRELRETTGHSPRSRTLACKGYRCQCRFDRA